MRVSDKHCSNCSWLKKAGKTISVKNREVKGYCPFKRYVKIYGFKSEQEKLQERIGG